MVRAIQKNVVVHQHGLKRVASPSSQEVVPHDMALRLYTVRCTGYFFRVIQSVFKGLFSIHTQNCTQRVRVKQHSTLHSYVLRVFFK